MLQRYAGAFWIVVAIFRMDLFVFMLLSFAQGRFEVRESFVHVLQVLYAPVEAGGEGPRHAEGGESAKGSQSDKNEE